MWVILLAWLLGFLLSVGIVFPFIIVHHVKGFAESAAGDIRGS